jgi:hypothetical protein
MRLQLIAALSFAARAAAADPAASLDLRSGIYQDSDRTFISTSTVAARGNIKDKVTVGARYLVDVITSASVDVVTAATAAFHETRHEAEGSVGYHDGTNTAGASYIYSVENDWQSHTANAGLTRDLLQHNLTLGIGGTFVHNSVGRAGDPNFRRRLLVGGGNVSLTATASPRDLVSLSYTLAYLSGYQASPYRYVFFAEGIGRASVAETDPDTRMRHALTLRWNRHLFTNTALQSHARGYLDDWGVASVTAGTEYLVGFGQVTLGLHARGYFQQHASFYRQTYAAPMRYMTADRELATFVDVFGGARLLWRRVHLGPFDELHAEAKVDGFGFWFFDFDRLPSRGGVIAELALGASL